MIFDKTSLVRQLVPTGYHFDGYNEINCPNSRDKPFFSDNVIQIGEHYYLTLQLVKQDKLSLTFSSVCAHGAITFTPYLITLEDFISKIKVAVNSGRDFVPFEISVQYNALSTCNLCKEANSDCREIRKNHYKKVYAAVSFEYNDMKEALASYFEITNNQTSKGGKNIMRNRSNKFFGVNFEFGLSKDPNIASTLMGMAVKNPLNGNWYVFDPERNTRKNIANVKIGSFPVMLIPTKQYVPGRLYKVDNNYFYVKSVNSNDTVTLIEATTGILRDQLPEETLIPGMNFHTEVIAFDANSLMNANSNESVGSNLLAAMLMMNWSKGTNAEFSLDSINDDSFNGLGTYLPLILSGQNGILGNFLTNADGTPNLVTLMALGSGDNENNEMMQMMVLSQLLGGGNSSFSGVIPNMTTKAKVVCNNCGITYSEGTNFCPKCGNKTSVVADTCRACGATLMEGATFCHKCGVKAVADVCPSCGRSIGEGENFCPKCGTSFKEPISTVTAAETPAVEPAVVTAPTVEPPCTEE